MKTNKKTLLKGFHWVLALMGFVGLNTTACVEYGSPYADYTVKGAVVDKATGKAIEGIRVGYYPQEWSDLFGAPEEYYSGSKAYAITNKKGEFTLTTEHFSYRGVPSSFFVEDIDGEKNGLFLPEKIEVDFSEAVHSGKVKNWYSGKYTLTQKVELTQVEHDNKK